MMNILDSSLENCTLMMLVNFAYVGVRCVMEGEEGGGSSAATWPWPLG